MGRRSKAEVDFMAAVAETLPLEVETKTDTFSISVKNDEKEVIYENKEEPYDYHVIPSLSTALEYFGAKMSEDQKAFLTEALRGDTTGPAVAKVIEVINGDLKTTAKSNRYQAVFNRNKPVSDESKTSAFFSIVRNFMKAQGVSDETAVTTLHGYGVIPDSVTLEAFRDR